ncbi:hypothetical protein CR513_32934, partial [Mucuna pruriens]
MFALEDAREILEIIGRGPNDQMLPIIAYAVAEGDTKDSWSWFLQLLIHDLGIQTQIATYTFIYDQLKGLLLALDELLLGVNQRLCIQHLYNNFKKKNYGKI